MTYLPEIVPASEHPRMAALIQKIRGNERELTSAALAAFGLLSAGEDALQDMRRSVEKGLSASSLEDLPCMVEFLLSTTDKGAEMDTVDGLRAGLNFNASRSITQMSQMQQSRRTQKSQVGGNQDSDIVILHQLDDCFSTKKRMANTWQRAVSESKSYRDVRVFDVPVLFLLHSMVDRKKSVQSSFKTLVKSGILNDDLLQTAFTANVKCMQHLLDQILEVAFVLGQSQEPSLAQASLLLRKEAFIRLDGAAKREILRDLMSHIGCGGAGATRASALKCLSSLAYEQGELLSKYNSFVVCLLDHMGNLTLSEVRSLMDLLSHLTYTAGDEQCSLRNNLHIIVKKQVNSKNHDVLRKGIAGLCAVVKNMASARSLDETMQTLSTQVIHGSSGSSSNLAEAGRLLNKVWESVSGEMAALFNEELAGVMEQHALDNRLAQYLSKK